jgi:tetratricopeptide (TPR) repeat protein
MARFLRIAVSGCLLLFPLAIFAAQPCDRVVGRLASLEGQIEVQSSGASAWQAATLNQSLCQGDTVRAAARSRATVALINQAVLRIDQNTAMRLDNISGVAEERSVLSLLKGAFQSFSRRPRGFEVSTPYLNGSIEGTEFVFRVTDDESILTVFEGIVLASNDQGSASVSGGEAVAAKAGQAPQARTVVRPRDAAQWSLYYPPILAAGGVQAQDALPALQQAASNLSVGQVDAARTSVEQAIAGQGADAGLAYALRAVINVVQNRREQALADGNQAVSLSPDSAAAKIALSYAQQGNFQINAARNTMQQAVAQQPQDALAWARLAELELMLGNGAAANTAASQAVLLAPDLGRTQITRGFAALAEFRNTDARAAFERGIELDSADPMPHLGLGLSKISAGDLEAGRKDIEVAVGLDSNNPLLRAYLGKAYFEEKRTPLDGEQFEIAKQLDPNDPTAFLYGGIAKQSENRPVEALQDMEASIERNDNRAAYRGRLLLDKDRAARGTSLAKVYNSLGFSRLGIGVSTQSLAIDPANASAHRFLADTYRGVRRREISRVSELLQSQLMQDININPVQPSNSVTNLNSVSGGGPASVGYNEFTPLFERNGIQVDASGQVGNNSTRGVETAVTGLHDQTSVSVGAYYYESDGWRPNNDLEEHVYNLYFQTALTPELNIQAELRRRESEEGDLAFNFDPDVFLDIKTVERDQDTARLGLRYSPAADTDWLFSYIYSDRDEELRSFETLDPFTTLEIDSKVNNKGYQIEGQNIYRQGRFNVITGLGYSNVDQKNDDFLVFDDITFPPPFVVDETTKDDITHPRGYLYTDINTSDTVTWTVGVSYDDFDSNLIDEQNFNPKFGVRWDATDRVQLRAAAFKTVKPILVNNRTIEPTQVAGFNQFFDDINATESRRYGAGLDWRMRHNLYTGAEATWRDLDEPVIDNNIVFFEDRREQLHRVYLYWTPVDQLGVSAEVVYDRYKSDKGIATEFDNLPEEVRTVSVPLGIRYFRPSGFFAGITGTYVDQKVDRFDFSTQGQGSDNFFLVDTSIGFRLPKRQGVISLEARNLFDKNFKYQDDSYREFRDEPATGPYFPDLTVLAQFSLNF